jgi:SAM-dependent methyltransferase
MKRDRIIFANGFAANDDHINNIWINTTKELELISEKLNYSNNGWISHWSRRWEFPWAFHAISYLYPREQTLPRVISGEIFTALETGSGFTEFPFWLAANGWTVTGTDVDASCEIKWAKMVRNAEFPSGPPKFQISDMEQLGFSDNLFDMVYSISAIEHTADPVKAVSEMIRVVRPGGAIIFTCDICNAGQQGLGRTEFEEIQFLLGDTVAPLLPCRHVLPGGLLTSTWKQKQIDGFLRSSAKGLLSDLGLYLRNEIAVFAFLGTKR